MRSSGIMYILPQSFPGGENEKGRSPIFVLQTVASFLLQLAHYDWLCPGFCNIYDSEQIVTAIVPYRYKDMSPTSANENFVPVPMLM